MFTSGWQIAVLAVVVVGLGGFAYCAVVLSGRRDNDAQEALKNPKGVCSENVAPKD